MFVYVCFHGHCWICGDLGIILLRSSTLSIDAQSPSKTQSPPIIELGLCFSLLQGILGLCPWRQELQVGPMPSCHLHGFLGTWTQVLMFGWYLLYWALTAEPFTQPQVFAFAVSQILISNNPFYPTSLPTLLWFLVLIIGRKWAGQLKEIWGYSSGSPLSVGRMILSLFPEAYWIFRPFSNFLYLFIHPLPT